MPEDLPLPAPDRCAWFLDIDGTLAEIADAPENVRIDPSMVRAVERLAQASDGAVAMISGRRIADIDRLFAPLRLPAAGQHGVERRAADASVHWHRPRTNENDIARMAEKTRAWAAVRNGLRVEYKEGSFAVHFRAAPQLGGAVRSFLEDLMQSSSGDYCLQPGKMVIEILPESRDKGTAVLEFMGEPPFLGRTPVFLGDDLADEHGFAVVGGLGGITVKVGAGDTQARWRLPGVDAVYAWIAAIVRARAIGMANR